MTLEEKLETAEMLVAYLKSTILEENLSNVLSAQWPEGAKEHETAALSHAEKVATLIRNLGGQA